MDIGIGDAVTPAPEWLEYPSLIDLGLLLLALIYSQPAYFDDPELTTQRLSFQGPDERPT